MWAMQIDRPGGPEAMVWREMPDPVPAAGQVLVEVVAVGLNYVDTYHRSGLYEVPLPFTLGMEGSGTVLALGEGVSSVAVGDRVAWAHGSGSYAERAVVAEQALLHVPDAVGLDVAAAIALQGMTAHFLSHDTFALGSGHRCLVHAGAGGVGLLLIQMAKMRGAEVFTTVGSAEKASLAQAAGADHTILYRDVDFAEEVARIAGPRPIDVVYDSVGRSTFQQSLQVLRPRGLMVSFGNASGPVDPITPLQLMANGSLYLTRPTLAHYTSTSDEVRRRAGDLFGWIAAGQLDVRIGATWPLREAAAAHRALEGRETTGKVLLLP
jgi:NADPH2:quinone reductase